MTLSNSRHTAADDPIILAVEKDRKELLDSFSRVTFILHKIVNGDHEALDNAPDAIKEAVAVLKKNGDTDEWMDTDE